MVKSKTCSACKRDLMITLFHRRYRSSDGYQEQCGECCAARAETQRLARKARDRAALLAERKSEEDDHIASIAHRLVPIEWPVTRRGT